MEGYGAQEQEVVPRHLVGDGGVAEDVCRQLGGSDLAQLHNHVRHKIIQISCVGLRREGDKYTTRLKVHTHIHVLTYMSNK